MLWVKSFHIIFMVTWFAGLFYLPRLFVYHAEAKDEISNERFKVMERKLLQFIMTPSMIGTWIFGIGLWVTVGGGGWLHAKVVLVIAMSAIHGYLSKLRKDFERDQNTQSTRFYRILNEVPAVLLLIILILVVAKPF